MPHHEGDHDLKQKQVPLDAEADEIEDHFPLPSVSLSKKATVESVREAIAALPLDFREVVVLRELVGLSYKEISAVSGILLGTVMSRLARARRQLYLLSFTHGGYILINLFIWPSESSRNTVATSFSNDGYNVLHWAHEGFEFWAVSDVDAEDT
jgi:hypothetical protein